VAIALWLHGAAAQPSSDFVWIVWKALLFLSGQLAVGVIEEAYQVML
jgi:hypothetical protein